MNNATMTQPAEPATVKLHVLKRIWAGSMMLEPGDVVEVSAKRLKRENGALVPLTGTEFAPADAKSFRVPKPAQPTVAGAGPRKPPQQFPA